MDTLPGVLQPGLSLGPCSSAVLGAGQTAGCSAPESMFSATLFHWHVGGSLLGPGRFPQAESVQVPGEPLVCTRTPPPGAPWGTSVLTLPQAAYKPQPARHALSSRNLVLTHSESTTLTGIVAPEVRVP